MGARPKSKASASRKDEIVIPDKLYFRIGEVSTLCKLPAYVLRFWETEFPQLKPVKSSTGQRMYRRKEVETVLRVKQLLYEEGFTIAGARKHLEDQLKEQAHAHGRSSNGDAKNSIATAAAEAPHARPSRPELASRAHRKFLLDLHEELLAVLTLLERE